MLDHAWRKLNECCAHPAAALVSIAFVTCWYIANFVTHNKFDPGLTVGSFFTNSIQLIVLFVAASAARAAAMCAGDASIHANAARQTSARTERVAQDIRYEARQAANDKATKQPSDL